MTAPTKRWCDSKTSKCLEILPWLHRTLQTSGGELCRCHLFSDSVPTTSRRYSVYLLILWGGTLSCFIKQRTWYLDHDKVLTMFGVEVAVPIICKTLLQWVVVAREYRVSLHSNLLNAELSIGLRFQCMTLPYVCRYMKQGTIGATAWPFCERSTTLQI